MNIVLIGCGVIGERRITNLPEGVKLVACVDINLDKAKSLAKSFGAATYSNLADLIVDFKEKKISIDAAIIATINSVITSVASELLSYQIPVLLEKPAARSYEELKDINTNNHHLIKIGFNHRFHPAYQDIIKEIKNNPEDPIMFIRANYGNGARVGFDKEWRANVQLSGGGELLDQGVHLLDLAANLLPNLQVESSWVRTHYWNMPVDDNAWAILSTAEGQTFSMHVSSSEWKNEFRFEVYTRNRKYLWLGLGRSYGPEKLFIYKMKPEMGPPEVEELSYSSEDKSWFLENSNFIQSIQGKSEYYGQYKDGLQVLKLVSDIYKKSEILQKGRFSHPNWWRSVDGQ